MTLTMKDEIKAVMNMVGMLNQRKSVDVIMGPENWTFENVVKTPPDAVGIVPAWGAILSKT